MHMNFNKYTITLMTVLFLSATTTSCSKDISQDQVELSYQMIRDKTWFLDYVETIKGTSINTKTYIGQPTYFINFLKDNTTLDSDRLSGTYSIEVLNGKILIKINSKTFGGNPVIYDYVVESIGSKVLVMSYNSNGAINKFYYSSK